ncbi:MAG: C1 family peptidase [archaeon]
MKRELVFVLIVICVLFFSALFILNEFSTIGKSIFDIPRETGDSSFEIANKFEEKETPLERIFNFFQVDSSLKIGMMFEEDGQIYPLDINKPIYSLKINGEINLNNENSLARVILIDSEGNEKLVYEAYPGIVNRNNFLIKEVCEETCVLNGISPENLRFEIEDASVNIKKIDIIDNFEELDLETKEFGIEFMQERLRKEQDQIKIDKINEKNPSWVAGETSVSVLSYTEKKGLFMQQDKLPNLQGFEYYKGGIFKKPLEKEYNAFNYITCNSCEDCDTKLNYYKGEEEWLILENDISIELGKSSCIDVKNQNRQNNMGLNCHGFSILGLATSMDGKGVNHEIEFEDFSIKNCEIKGFKEGISISNYGDLILKNNEIKNNHIGIVAEYSHVIMEESIVNENYIGIENSFATLIMSNSVLCGNAQKDLFVNPGGFVDCKNIGCDKTNTNYCCSKNCLNEEKITNVFDWRERHGENWITSIKNQGGCGSCWVFGSTATIESLINLFYNNQINIDLSEQNVLCERDGGTCEGGNPYSVFERMKTKFKGVYDEECTTYWAVDSCLPPWKCGNWQNRLWKIKGGGLSELDSEKSDFLLKEDLIKRGPLGAGISSWWHWMSLIGYWNDYWKIIDNCEKTERQGGPYIDLYSPLGCGLIRTTNCEIGNKICYRYNIQGVCEDIGEITSYVKYPCEADEQCISGECIQKDPRSCETGEILYDGPYKKVCEREDLQDIFWIFKNSWGEEWGSGGFAITTIYPQQDLSGGYYAEEPYFVSNPNLYQINCLDKDNDKFCNWGISKEKPDTCPEFCLDEKDCDDSNPNLGPYDERFNCVEIG